MIKVFTAGGLIVSRHGGIWAGLIALVAFTLSGTTPSQAQNPVAPKAAGSPAPKQAPAQAKEAEPSTDDEIDATTEAADGEAQQPAADPSESHKAATLEIFKDPNAELALDLKKYPEIRATRMPSQAEIDQVKQMAGSPLVAVDQTVMQNVVNGMIAQLTNTKNIQAVIDPNDKTNPNSSTARAIQESTQHLLEPIFMARNAKNVQFQTKYNQVLLQRLAPVLKHHLVPRIQAMIVLGQSGNPEALKLFLEEIKNPAQTVWVKLWAFRGITNIKLLSNRLSASQEIDAAKAVADQLVQHKDWPWTVQLRALESLAALRQGFLPTSPRTADMASAAFQYLIDKSLKPDVRAEAARALGAMQITTAVPKYNFEVAAYATAQLSVELGEQVLSAFTENKTRAQKLTTLLVGPVFQAFEGDPANRDSGFLRNPSLANRADVQKYLDAVRPMAKTAVALVGAPTGQIKALTEDLTAKLATLKDYLAKNPPASLQLFTGGPEYSVGAAPAQAAAGAAPANVVAGAPK